MIVFLEVVSLSLRAVPSDRRNIDESCSILNESSSFDRDIDICKVVQAEIDKFFKFVLPNVIFDALRVNKFTDFSISSLPFTATRPFSLKK